MFTSLHSGSSLKQPITFVASICLQFAVLVVLCGGPYPQMFGPSIRPGAMSSALVTPIYFHKDTIADSITREPSTTEAPPVESPLAPRLPDEVKSDPEQEANAQTETVEGGSGKGEAQGLAPFPGWRMNSAPSSFTIMHHQIKTALPIFTPDPPILQNGVPELARGKDLVLEVVIDDQGSIAQVQVLQAVGYEVESSIMQTLRRWIFVPAKINGVAIASRRQLRFHFSS